MNPKRHPERGQTIVVFALAVTALIAMAGLIIDGGNAFAQQRRTQNGADAAAEAGAVQLARRMMRLPGDDATWDQRVDDAVRSATATNGLTTTDVPQYTDIEGTVLGPVGTGTIPADTAGVQASGSRSFGTFLAGVIGIGSITASAQATAVTGYAAEASAGSLLPITFPIIITQCEAGGGSNKLFHPNDGEEWPYGPNNRVALPLCSNGPGNVGWIDWDPPHGGAADVADSIRNPDGPPVTTPHWYFVAETGAITSLDDDLDQWEGRDILLPIFHVQADDPATPEDESLIGTCDTEPTGDETELDDCPAGHNGGTGQNQWYYLVTFAQFRLEHSYIQGNHEPECNDPSLASVASNSPTGRQRLNNCLIGYFQGPVVASNVTVRNGPPTSSFTPVGVQLIR